jgi:hypothetical protein
MTLTSVSLASTRMTLSGHSGQSHSAGSANSQSGITATVVSR